MTYIGNVATDSQGVDHKNSIKISVTIPHWDGLVPIISTRKPSNFRLMLSKDAVRVGVHKCSNLLDYNEISTKYGFLSNSTDAAINQVEPYQFSEEMRGDAAVRFYRNLDLESCLWEFVTYYDVSELVTECGALVDTSGQVVNSVQSYVSVRVPLYVSYVYHSLESDWQHSDLSTELRLTFLYDTAVLVKQGIGALQDSQLKGFLYLTRMNIGPDGRLFVDFKTEPMFRGLFVLSHPELGSKSYVYTADHPDLTFTLKLLRTESTNIRPQQEWQFFSDYAIRDYSGTYHVWLMPCIISNDFSSNVNECEPHPPISFDINVHFQQVSDPVPAEYTLNTHLHLARKRDLWFSEAANKRKDTDSMFLPGDVIYGKVVVDPKQKLGQSFFVNVEKCFLCTGIDGYLPKYDPSKREYGCATDSTLLLHSLKIIDKDDPGTTVTEFGGVPFDAVLAMEDPEFNVEVSTKNPSVDGFRFSSQPLFQVGYGSQWFIQCFYTVRSRESAVRSLKKRSYPEVTSETHLQKENEGFDLCNRTLPYNITDIINEELAKRKRSSDALRTGHGTNMNPIILSRDYVIESSSVFVDAKDVRQPRDESIFPVTTISSIAFGLLFFMISSLVFYVAKKKRSREDTSSAYTPTIIRYTESRKVVVKKKYCRYSRKGTEV